MPPLRYHLVDVFTDTPFGGNQLAVYMDGRGLSGEQMQQIAREMNLSETTFILPPDDPANDYHVRIFTTLRELPMAGHPTVGTTFVLGREKMIDVSGASGRANLEEGVGLIPVLYSVENGLPGMIAMQQPMPRFGPIFEDRAGIAEMLSLSVSDLDDTPLEVVSCGVPYLMLPLRSRAAVENLRLRGDIWERLLAGFATDALFIFTRETVHPDSTVHSRMFVQERTITEDPATGSANGPMGCYLVKHGLVKGNPAHIVSEQGFEMGRPSLLYIDIERDGEAFTRVSVGGRCVYMGEGTLHLT